MILLCLALVPLALLISLPMTWVLIRASHRVGALDHPDDPSTPGRKWHGRAVPNTGGIAIFWAVALPLAVALTSAWAVPAHDFTGLLESASQHLPGLRQQTPLALAVVAALAVMHVLGLVDDRKNLGAGIKLSVQLLVALCLAGLFNLRIFDFLPNMMGTSGHILSIFLSVIWIVAITNAMNMLDNMDGLSAGVGTIIAGLYLAAAILGGQWFVAAASALLMGALLGFLVFNFPGRTGGARIFMGDGGSLVLGLLLAIISIRTTYVGTPSPDAIVGPGRWYGVLMPAIFMAIPLYDFTSVTLIRMARGLSPFVGDRNHFSHRLVRRGLSQPAAVLVIWLCTLATGLGGVMLGRLAGWQAALVTAQALAVLTVLALLERGSETKP